MTRGRHQRLVGPRPDRDVDPARGRLVERGDDTTEFWPKPPPGSSPRRRSHRRRCYDCANPAPRLPGGAALNEAQLALAHRIAQASVRVFSWTSSAIMNRGAGVAIRSGRAT